MPERKKTQKKQKKYINRVTGFLELPKYQSGKKEKKKRFASRRWISALQSNSGCRSMSDVSWSCTSGRGIRGAARRGAVAGVGRSFRFVVLKKKAVFLVRGEVKWSCEEVVCEVELELMKGVLNRCPSWASGLPCSTRLVYFATGMGSPKP